MPIATVNPATGETVRTFDPHSAEEVQRRVALASETFRRHSRTSFEQRTSRMARVAVLLEERAEAYGKLITLEMGKPIGAAIAEVKKCALVCRHYAEHGEAFLQPRVVETEAKKSWVAYQPLGVILAVMPWNFPFWQVFRFIAPGITAGNVGLLKHASNVPQCALAIEEVMRDAGFEDGVFQTLLIGAKEVRGLIDDARVAAVTLTGSEPAGRDVASHAADLVKKSVLELGGSDPFVVMPSADLDKAVATAVKARMVNNGQSCIAAKRFIVHQEIADEFERRFVEAVAALKIGDPFDPSSDIGPLANEQILEDLAAQVEATVKAGGRIGTGGKRVEGKGFYFQPTVLLNVPRESPGACEETFGPVAAVIRVDSLDEAVEVANDTPFGLGASAWTNDAAERQRFIDDIQAGMVFINAMVASHPKLPFGGVKRSGFGRELGIHGIHEFVNIKTVWVD